MTLLVVWTLTVRYFRLTSRDFRISKEDQVLV